MDERTELEAIEQDPALIEELTREECILLLVWRDPHGIYTDADSLAKGHPPLTLASAHHLLREMIAGQPITY